MRLLVSVATADDARAAVDGDADIVDAKDPSAGALGPVSVARLREIRDAVAGALPLTAALGDAVDEAMTERRAREFADAGATLVKIGLFGTARVDRAIELAAAAMRGLSTTTSGVVLVAYADASADAALAPDDVIEVAARVGARGVLIDTMDKDGPGLLGVMSPENVSRWVTRARAAGLLVAVAGKLTAGDLSVIDRMGADVAGVRGAACLGGRSGQVSAGLVRDLVAQGRHAARSASRSSAVTTRLSTVAGSTCP